MKKVFSIIMLLALTATTAFVFASSKKFANEGLYVEKGGSHYRISNDASISGLQLQLPGTQGVSTISIKDPSGATRNLHFFDGTNYVDVLAANSSWQ